MPSPWIQGRPARPAAPAWTRPRRASRCRHTTPHSKKLSKGPAASVVLIDECPLNARLVTGVGLSSFFLFLGPSCGTVDLPFEEGLCVVLRFVYAFLKPFAASHTRLCVGPQPRQVGGHVQHQALKGSKARGFTTKIMMTMTTSPHNAHPKPK